MPVPESDAQLLAELYDPLDPDRSDLDVYAAMVEELGARSVLDVGCGTGTFACMLAAKGIEVTGVDPDEASLNVARRKPGADRVTWIHGDATQLPPTQVDLATMTANVAQVFLDDDDWLATLRGIHAALKPGGRLIFETRDPARKAWLGWNPEASRDRTEIPGIGMVESWYDVLDVTDDPLLVTFRSTNIVEASKRIVSATDTLRFRSREKIERSLSDAGFEVQEVRDAPDRPGREFVFITARQ